MRSLKTCSARAKQASTVTLRSRPAWTASSTCSRRLPGTRAHGKNGPTASSTLARLDVARLDVARLDGRGVGRRQHRAVQQDLADHVGLFGLRRCLLLKADPQVAFFAPGKTTTQRSALLQRAHGRPERPL